MRGSGAWRMSSSAVADRLERPGEARPAERARPTAPARPRPGRTVATGRAHGDQEDVAQRASSASPSTRGSRPAAHGGVDGRRGPAPASAAARASTRSSTGIAVVDDAAGGGDLVERRQRVAGRAAADAHDVLDGVVVEVEAGVGDDLADVVGQHLGRQQVELEVLGAAADGGQHLLRVGGGQHEHDVVGRLLERLEQRVRRRRR